MEAFEVKKILLSYDNSLGYSLPLPVINPGDLAVRKRDQTFLGEEWQV